MALRALTLLLAVSVAAASCPNKCSGHGQCSTNDKCSCYSNYQGSDCSARTSREERVCLTYNVARAVVGTLCRASFHCGRGGTPGPGVGFPCNLPTACGIGTTGPVRTHARNARARRGVSAPAHPHFNSTSTAPSRALPCPLLYSALRNPHLVSPTSCPFRRETNVASASNALECLVRAGS